MIYNENLHGISQDNYPQPDIFGRYYVIYRITNKINNKFYIGAHKTYDLINNDYYGSGIAIQAAIKKYGLLNFTREYLFFIDTEINMYQKEHEIVSTDFLKYYKGKTYNLTVGGLGSNIHKKRKPELYTYNNQTLTFQDQADLYRNKNLGLSGDAIKSRILKRNWDPYLAMTTPFQPTCQYRDFYFDYNNEHLNLEQLSKKYHVGVCALHHQIFYNKKTIEEAIKITRNRKARNLWYLHNIEKVLYTYNKISLSLKEWAKIKNIRLQTLIQRLKRDKMTFEEAITLPVVFGNNQQLRHIKHKNKS